jgi:hypothetical protein
VLVHRLFRARAVHERHAGLRSVCSAGRAAVRRRARSVGLLRPRRSGGGIAERAAAIAGTDPRVPQRTGRSGRVGRRARGAEQRRTLSLASGRSDKARAHAARPHDRAPGPRGVRALLCAGQPAPRRRRPRERSGPARGQDSSLGGGGPSGARARRGHGAEARGGAGDGRRLWGAAPPGRRFGATASGCPR